MKLLVTELTVALGTCTSKRARAWCVRVCVFPNSWALLLGGARANDRACRIRARSRRGGGRTTRWGRGRGSPPGGGQAAPTTHAHNVSGGPCLGEQHRIFFPHREELVAKHGVALRGAAQDGLGQHATALALVGGRGVHLPGGRGCGQHRRGQHGHITSARPPPPPSSGARPRECHATPPPPSPTTTRALARGLVPDPFPQGRLQAPCRHGEPSVHQAALTRGARHLDAELGDGRRAQARVGAAAGAAPGAAQRLAVALAAARRAAAARAQAGAGAGAVEGACINDTSTSESAARAMG